MPVHDKILIAFAVFLVGAFIGTLVWGIHRKWFS